MTPNLATKKKQQQKKLIIASSFHWAQPSVSDIVHTEYSDERQKRLLLKH